MQWFLWQGHVKCMWNFCIPVLQEMQKKGGVLKKMDASVQTSKWLKPEFAILFAASSEVIPSRRRVFKESCSGHLASNGPLRHNLEEDLHPFVVHVIWTVSQHVVNPIGLPLAFAVVEPGYTNVRLVGSNARHRSWTNIYLNTKASSSQDFPPDVIIQAQTTL